MSATAAQLAQLEALQYAVGSGHQTTTYGGAYVVELREGAHRMYTRPLSDRLKAAAPADVSFDEAIADLRALIRIARSNARIDTLIRGLEHAASAIADHHPLMPALQVKLGIARGDRASADGEAEAIRQRIITILEPGGAP